MRAHRAWPAVRQHLAGAISWVGPAIGSIFMLPKPYLGLILWLALLEDNPRHAGFAALGLAAGDCVGRFLKIRDVPTIGGGVRANALLAGMAVAWTTSASGLDVPTEIALALITSGVAAILTAAVIRLLTATILPPLIWGYCFAAGTFFLLFPRWTLLAANATAPWLAPVGGYEWASAFVRSLGSLIFAPTLVAGLIVGTAIVMWSRILFLTGVIGWLVGAVTASELQRLGVNYYWMPASYNYFIAGMALGSAYFLPGRASAFIAAAAGAGTSLIAAVLQIVGPTWAFLPVSSGIAIWLGIGALVLAEEQGAIWRNFLRRVPPEEAWWRVNYWARRVGRREPLLVLPVSGPVQVSQSFSGTLSHFGQWRYALDFQRPTSGGSHDQSDSIWNVAVVAPAPGMVERVRDDVPDNPIGICNYADNWGNYVLVRLDQGGWVLLAHLRQGTVAVRPGTRVEIGSHLGAVGNSGRSPVPHLHLQAQLSPQLGARTVPFRLANFESLSPNIDEPRWVGTAVPQLGAILTAAPASPHVHTLLASMAPGTAIWSVEIKGKVPRAFRPRRGKQSERIDMGRDAAGRYVFICESGGTLITVLDPDAWRVIDFEGSPSPLLQLLALAAPSVPYTAKVGLSWDEPILVLTANMWWLTVVFAPYRRNPFKEVRSSCVAEPASPQGQLVVETHTDSAAHLPSQLTCCFEQLRGPVKVEAVFADGHITYSQLSFEPHPRDYQTVDDAT